MKRNSKVVRIVALILVISMVVIAVVSVAMSFFSHAEELADSETMTTTNWMSGLSDDMAISEITIPGTHDSASNYVTPAYFLKCQNTSIAEQLANGYRYLDIRLALDEDKDGTARLKFIHAFANCRSGMWWFSKPLYLEDVLDAVYSFLDENPTETVIFCVKAENGDDDVASFEALFYDTIDKNADKWYTVNEIPTLGEVRGKAVLATRFEDVNAVGDTRTGLQFYWEEQDNTEVVDLPYAISMINDTQALWVQDRYKYTVESKIDAFMDDLANCQADENTFSLNFASLSGSGLIVHPKGNARTINAEILDTELRDGTSYGVLIVDFATAEIAEHIYGANF